ncbi:MAG TPA: chemotaxis protein CheW [Thermoanaerobaculia bacterium]|nr:chemotaxis protein CheW [Thermoanaerobaculia bacterium]
MTVMRSEPATEPAARFALVAVDGVEYAIDAAWVRRSLPAPRPLPSLVPHGGATFQVVDLRQLFGLPAATGLPAGPDPRAAAGAPLPPATSTAAERLMLLVEQPPARSQPGGAASRLALVVDDLLGIERLDPGAAQPLPAVYRGPERAWFRGLVPRAGGRVTVLLRLTGLSAAAVAAMAAGGSGC